uniref:Uncharacterized protein n=1 Tax=Cowpox virus TaxID=10243 RepID=A0A0K2YUD9_COWPX|nr:hypothetical protein pCPXV0275 [Cowpox virus]CRL86758.1 hypothetical protein pCPXV0275 [Cowpox virus]
MHQLLLHHGIVRISMIVTTYMLDQYLKIIYFWKENTMILSINLLTVPLATLLITTIKHMIMISSLY